MIFQDSTAEISIFVENRKSPWIQSGHSCDITGVKMMKCMLLHRTKPGYQTPIIKHIQTLHVTNKTITMMIESNFLDSYTVPKIGQKKEHLSYQTIAHSPSHTIAYVLLVKALHTVTLHHHMRAAVYKSSPLAEFLGAGEAVDFKGPAKPWVNWPDSYHNIP